MTIRRLPVTTLIASTVTSSPPWMHLATSAEPEAEAVERRKKSPNLPEIQTRHLSGTIL